MQMTAKVFLFRGWKSIFQMASFKTLISWARKLRSTDKQFVQGHKVNLAADCNLELQSPYLSPLLRNVVGGSSRHLTNAYKRHFKPVLPLELGDRDPVLGCTLLRTLLLSFPRCAFPQGRVQRAYRDMPTHSLQPQPVQIFWYLEHQNDPSFLPRLRHTLTQVHSQVKGWRWRLSMPCTPIPQPEGWWRVVVCRKSVQTFGTQVKMSTSYARGFAWQNRTRDMERGLVAGELRARGPRASTPQ